MQMDLSASDAMETRHLLSGENAKLTMQFLWNSGRQTISAAVQASKTLIIGRKQASPEAHSLPSTDMAMADTLFPSCPL